MKKLNILSLLIPIILGTQTTSAKMMEDGNVTIWRIPLLLRTKDGVLIAAANKRWQHRDD